MSKTTNNNREMSNFFRACWNCVGGMTSIIARELHHSTLGVSGEKWTPVPALNSRLYIGWSWTNVFVAFLKLTNKFPTLSLQNDFKPILL